MTSPGWLAELDLRPGPPHHRMGTRAVPEDRWLTGGEDLARQLAEKQRLVDADHPAVFSSTPDGSEAAAVELADTVVAWLARHRPAAGRELAADLHPVDAAARLVAEDLCLLEERSGGWTLTAASVSFPSRWRLADKVGRPVGAIHAPVPHYAELAPAVDRFLDRLAPGRIAVRRNWTLHADQALFQPAAPPARPRAHPSHLVLRSERQTLRRLPGSGAVAFTIRTQQVALADVTDLDARRRLAAVLESFSAELAGYKAGDYHPAEVVDWLRR